MEDKIIKAIDLTDRYCAIWNEADQTKKRSKLKEIWQAEGKYIDPRSNLTGVEALVNHIEKIQSKRRGTKIIRTSNLDMHHGIGRFNWQLRKGDDTLLLEGLDIIYFDEQVTKIKKIIGFFGALKSE